MGFPYALQKYITFSEVQAWIIRFAAGDESPRSARTEYRAYGILASILDVAVRDKRIRSQSGSRSEAAATGAKRNIVYLSLTSRLQDSGAGCGRPRSRSSLLLAYSGLRWGEAIGLRVKDIDLEGGRISREA